MQMARPPAQPPVNLPQAIVDLVTLLKDPSWLKPFVEAAKEVSEANHLTEEEAESLADAKAVIERASGIDKELQGKSEAVTSALAEVAKRESALSVREKQCDDRNTAIAQKESLQVQETARLQSLASALAKREAAAALQERANAVEAGRLTQLAKDLDQAEKNFDTARNLVAKKKSNG